MSIKVTAVRESGLRDLIKQDEDSAFQFIMTKHKDLVGLVAKFQPFVSVLAERPRFYDRLSWMQNEHYRALWALAREERPDRLRLVEEEKMTRQIYRHCFLSALEPILVREEGRMRALLEQEAGSFLQIAQDSCLAPYSALWALARDEQGARPRIVEQEKETRQIYRHCFLSTLEPVLVREEGRMRALLETEHDSLLEPFREQKREICARHALDSEIMFTLNAIQDTLSGLYPQYFTGPVLDRRIQHFISEITPLCKGSITLDQSSNLHLGPRFLRDIVKETQALSDQSGVMSKETCDAFCQVIRSLIGCIDRYKAARSDGWVVWTGQKVFDKIGGVPRERLTPLLTTLNTILKSLQPWEKIDTTPSPVRKESSFSPKREGDFSPPPALYKS